MADVFPTYTNEELQVLLGEWHKTTESREYRVSYTLCLHELAHLGEHFGPIVQELLVLRALQDERVTEPLKGR